MSRKHAVVLIVLLALAGAVVSELFDTHTRLRRLASEFRAVKDTISAARLAGTGRADAVPRALASVSALAARDGGSGLVRRAPAELETVLAAHVLYEDAHPGCGYAWGLLRAHDSGDNLLEAELELAFRRQAPLLVGVALLLVAIAGVVGHGIFVYRQRSSSLRE